MSGGVDVGHKLKKEVSNRGGLYKGLHKGARKPLSPMCSDI